MNSCSTFITASAFLLAVSTAQSAVPDDLQQPGNPAEPGIAPGGGLALSAVQEKDGEQEKDKLSKKTSKTRKKSRKTKGRGRTRLKSDVPLEKLVKLNAKALFGSGKVTISGDRVEVLLNKDGHLYSAFEGKGLMDSTHERMKGAYRKFIQYGDQKGGEKLLPGLTAVGMEGGMWISRFRLAGETKVSFQIRLPNLLTGASSLGLIINWDGKTGYETHFFNSISKLSRGKPRGTHVTANKDFQQHARKWFPRKGEPVPVEYGIQDSKCFVRFDGKDMVSTKASDKGGRVAFRYTKIVFTLQDLKISGKIDLEWCKKRLGELQKTGELIEEAKVVDEFDQLGSSKTGDDAGAEK